jgi:hypothetical protein
MWSTPGEHALVDPVGHGRHEHVGELGRLDQLGLRKGLVVAVQPRIEQLHHPGFDDVGQLPRHHHHGLGLRHGRS